MAPIGGPDGLRAAAADGSSDPYRLGRVSAPVPPLRPGGSAVGDAEQLVDRDPARARTLPSRAYLDRAWLAAERDLVFRGTWQWAAAVADLASPGDYVTADIAGEPVLLVRQDDGDLRALSNVCRHRAGPVADGCGHARAFTCGYHGWRYHLDGSLASAREMGDPAPFDPGGVHLPTFRLETWSGFAFVDLSGGAPPLGDHLGEIVEEVAPVIGRDDGDVALVAERSDVIACNWKTYIDNYLEGYHIPYVHPRLHRILDTPAYRVEPRRFHSRQHAPLRTGTDHVYDRAAEPVLYYWLYPNIMLNVYPGNVQLNVVTPVDAEQTRTWFAWFARPPADDAERRSLDEAVALAGEVQDEDIAICEAVQRGLRSRTYDRGWYSTRHEGGVHHFHRLLCEALSTTSASGT